MSELATQVCPRCKIEKILVLCFSEHGHYCRQCAVEKANEWREKNSAKMASDGFIKKRRRDK